MAASGGRDNSQEVRQTLAVNPEASAYYTTAFDASSGAVTLSTYFRYTTLTSAALYADDSIFARFRGFNANGLGAVDNLGISQIPEPSAFAALAGLGVLSLAASHRRRRA